MAVESCGSVPLTSSVEERLRMSPKPGRVVRTARWIALAAVVMTIAGAAAALGAVQRRAATTLPAQATGSVTAKCRHGQVALPPASPLRASIRGPAVVQSSALTRCRLASAASQLLGSTSATRRASSPPSPIAVSAPALHRLNRSASRSPQVAMARLSPDARAEARRSRGVSRRTSRLSP